jgi:hypothetical protein
LVLQVAPRKTLRPTATLHVGAAAPRAAIRFRVQTRERRGATSRTRLDIEVREEFGLYGRFRVRELSANVFAVELFRIAALELDTELLGSIESVANDDFPTGEGDERHR